MPLTPGQMLAHYRLAEMIGQGGMGVVWRAEDTRLGRDVAVKVLSDAFSQDAERLARFEREAKLLASINHVNIASIYGIEESDGIRFLVLELIPGDTLGEKIARGPVPVDEALGLARQIAEALEAAHATGVLHRDLKPPNVKVTPDGRVKVLDFGLAKAFAPDSSSQSLSLSPTVTTAGTAHGVILGTAAYMSPEQARGKPVDKRTDVWALGCLLFEMLTGRQAFGGETASDTIASILKTEPDWASLPGSTPARAHELLQRCLAKDPRNRFHDIADARIEMERCIAGTDSMMTSIDQLPAAGLAPAPPRRGAWGTIVAAALIGAILGALAWSRVVSPGTGGSDDAVVRLSVPLPDDLTIENVYVSGDGRRIVYRAQPTGNDATEEPVSRLYLRSLDDFETRPIPGTERAHWGALSPDGRQLAYLKLSRSGGGGKVWKVALDGGPPASLLDVTEWPGNFMAGEWRRDGTLLLALSGGGRLVRLPMNGGHPETLLELDQSQETSVVLGSVSLPDGEHVLLNIGFVGKDGLRSRIEIFSLRTKERRTLLDGGGAQRYMPGGDLLFSRMGDTTLRVARLDIGNAALGPERPLASLAGQFAVSRTGTLIHVPERERTLHLVQVDRQGAIEELASLEGMDADGIRWSPGGERLSLMQFDGQRLQNEIWIYEGSRRALRPLRFPDGFVSSQIWTPDGRTLTFSAILKVSGSQLYQRDADGRDAPELLELEQEGGLTAGSWSPDGSMLAATHDHGGTVDIWMLPDSDPITPMPFRAGPANERRPRFSPDGAWLAYESDETGTWEIHVAGYAPGRDGPRGSWRVSTEGGSDPIWSPDGKELFFEDPRGRLLAVSFRPPAGPDDAPGLGAPRELLDLEALGLLHGGRRSYDIHPDGEHFAFIEARSKTDTGPSMKVVLNWFQDATRDSE